MNQMVGRSSGGGGLWNRVSLQVQGREAGRAMGSLPPFRSRAHLATPAVRLQGAERTMAFGKAAAELRGPPGHLKGGALCGLLCFYASNGSEPASDALDEPSSSLRGHLDKLAELTTPAVRLPGVQEQSSSSPRVYLAKPAVSLLQGAERTAHLAKTAVSRVQGAGRTMGFGNPAAQVRGSPGHIKGGALGGLLTCYASNGGSEPPSAFVDDPSASSLHDKLDVLHNKLDLLHRKLEDMVSTKISLKQLIWWIPCAVFSVVCVVLVVGTLYNVAGGRRYVEAEISRVTKTVFFTIANDAEISDKIDKLIIEKVDISVAYISSVYTWYKWLFGK